MSKFISQGKYKIVKNIIYGVKILSKVQLVAKARIKSMHALVL